MEDRMFVNDGVYLAKVMKDHLNTWPKKPAEFKLEDLGKDSPSIMLQQLSAAEKKRTYVNGSYIGVWNFAVYVRISDVDTASRLDATGCLNELADWLTHTSNGVFVNLPVIDENRIATKIEMTSTPSIAGRDDNGTEDYQAIFQLEYNARRN